MSSKPTVYGIVAKIADFYGMDSAKELLRRLKITKPRWPSNYSANILETVMSNDIIKNDVARFQPNLPVDRLAHENYLKDSYFMTKSYKVCKLCLAEGSLHQVIWQRPFYTHCLKHQVRLSEACEHIYADQTWHPKNLCTKCETTCTAANIPAYLQYWSSLRTEEQRDAFISDLIGISRYMMRPLDYIVAGLAWDRLSISELEAIFSDAFAIGSNSKAYDIWSGEVIKHRSVLSHLGNATATHLMNDLKTLFDKIEWPAEYAAFSVPRVLRKYHAIIDKKRYRKAFHILDEDVICCNADALSMRVNSKLVSQILDINAEALPSLVDSEILPVKKAAARTDKLIFDIHDISQAIYNIFDTPVRQTANTVTVRGAGSEVISTLLLTSKLITKHLLSKRLKGYWAVDSTLSLINRTTLCKQSLKDVFEYELSNSDHLSEREVAKLLGIRVPGVRSLVAQGRLSWARWQRGCNEFVDIESVRVLLRDYICIDREAILKDIDKEELLAQVASCCGKSPDIQEKGFKDSLTIALYKKSSLNPCCLSIATNDLEVLANNGLDLSKKVRRYSNVA